MVGLTTIELMIVMALLLILVTVAGLVFKGTLQTSDLMAQINALMGDVNFARSEAFKRGVRVTVCKRGKTLFCDTSAGQWTNGWTVFVDMNANNVVDNSESVLRVHEALSGYLAVRDNFAGYISYTSEGATQKINGAFQSGTIAFCDSPSGKSVRRMVISKSGRPRICDQSDVSCTLQCP